MNILLSLAYLRYAPACISQGAISEPMHKGILGFLGWGVAVVIASAILPCSLGLGFSVALRKKARASQASLLSLQVWQA